MSTTQKLIEALVKIAAENDEWGPFPEANNPAWGPMAIVEARTALKEYRAALAAAKQEQQAEPEVPVDESIADEIALLRSVLLGYPQSFSRADALRALHRVSCAFGAVYTNPVPGEQK